MINNHEQKHQVLDKLAYYYSETVAALPAADASNSGQHRAFNNIDYYSDGTRWLSTQLQRMEVEAMAGQPSSLAANTNGVLWETHPNNSSDIYVTAITTNAFVQTTNSGVSYWKITIRTRQASTANATTTFVADTSAGAPNVLIPLSSFLTSPGGAALPQIILRSDFYDMRVDFAKAGATATPGNIFYDPINIWYRLIG